MKRPLRVLLFSTLFPSATRPTHGVFVEARLRELRKLGDIANKPLAISGPKFGEYLARERKLLQDVVSKAGIKTE